MYLIHILNDFNHTDNFDHTDDAEAWDRAYAHAVERAMNGSDLVHDGETGEIREWREGDDEDDAVEAIEWDIRPPDAAVGTSYIMGEWYDEHGRSMRHVVRGDAFKTAWLDANNKAIDGAEA